MKAKNRFSVALLWGLVLALGCGAGETAGITAAHHADPLEPLRAHLNDQAAFETKARAFDKLHTALARLAGEEARQFERSGKSDDMQAAHERAHEHLRLVKEAYELGLNHFEQSAPLHNFYGELLDDFFGRSSEAIAHWEQAIEANPSYARSHNNLGMSLFHIGMYAQGLQRMDTAIQLEPDNPDYLFNLTQAYLIHFPQIMGIRNWDRPTVYREAMKMSARAAQLAPDDFEVVRDHGMNFFLAPDFGVEADWSEATKAWQAARERARNDEQRFNTWLNEARVHLRNQDKEQARTCLVEALSLWPDSPVARKLFDELND